MSNTKKTSKGENVLFAILVALTLLGLLTSCTVDQYNDQELLEQYLNEYNSQRSYKKFEPKSFIVSESKYKTIYIDTLIDQNVYFSIYAEANAMPKEQQYNGENNIWATFFTPDYYNNYDTGDSVPTAPYVASTAVRFDRPRTFNGQTNGYQPETLDLYTKQNIGPIHTSAAIKRDTISIYMDVSFDGKYHVKDTLFVVLRGK